MFAKKQPAMETIVGAGTLVTGELISKGTVRIDGKLEGRVRADWVIVAESGLIGGNVVCRGVVVGGKLEGTIHAGEVVDIGAHGEVVGDIHTPRLAVTEGGTLEGRSYMHKTREAATERPEGVLPFASGETAAR